MRKLFIYQILAAFLVAAFGFAGPLDRAEHISISMESVPLTKLLQMIAKQNNLNLVMSDSVHGDVSVRLEDVDLATALDAILTANGYSYSLRGNIVVIRPANGATAENLASRTVTLKYLDPVTAAKALESRRSAQGKVVILDKHTEGEQAQSTYHSNRILITDYPSVVDELVALVAEMDQPERAVLIEARIIETTLDTKTKLGFLWPSAVGTKISGVSDGSSTESTEGTDVTTTSNAAGAYSLEGGSWTLGTLSVDQLRVVLDMLDSDGNSKLISDPRITTIENHEAVISIATIIPIQTINRFTEAASTQDIVTFEDQEVGISLKVTPRINEGGRITLDVEPKVEDIVGFTGPTDNQRPITTERSVRTRVTVNDGETIALGGLLKESEIKRAQRIPFLGHIPLLGSALFTNRSNEKSTSDLIILITPHILPIQ